MDAMRGVLMSLGVIYHSALIFQPNLVWRVAESSKDPVLGWLARFIHAFRMPSFFIVAGYFCFLIIHKYGDNGFLRNRLQRLVIPLLATAVLINPWTNYLSANRPAVSFNEYLFSPEYFYGGAWMVQLWFLNTLLVFCFLCFVGVKLMRLAPIPHASLDRMMESAPKTFALALALALPIGNAVIARIFWHTVDNDAMLGGIIDPADLSRYLPYFLFGCVIWHSKILTQRFTSAWFWLTALAIASALLWMAPTVEGKDAPRYIEYANYLAAWGLSSLCLAFFRQFFNRPSAVFRYLSDASYTIYLMHMLFVIALGALLATTDLPVYLKFGLLVICTTVASLACHHFLVRRIPIVSLLLNGKMPVKPKANQQGAAEPTKSEAA
jgi:glucan biosynthesis protein C